MHTYKGIAHFKPKNKLAARVCKSIYELLAVLMRARSFYRAR